MSQLQDAHLSGEQGDDRHVVSVRCCVEAGDSIDRLTLNNIAQQLHQNPMMGYWDER